VSTATSAHSSTSIKNLQSVYNVPKVGFNKLNSEFSGIPRSTNYIEREIKEKSKSHSINSKYFKPYQTQSMVDTKYKIISISSKEKLNGKNKLFVAQVQQLPNGQFQMIPIERKIPICLKNVFKRNSSFTKQKIALNLTPNKFDDVNSRSSVNSHKNLNFKKMRYFQQKSQRYSGKFAFVTSKSINSMNRNQKLIPHTITRRYKNYA